MEAVIETFKPVMGYEGLYEVSNCGAVRSIDYQGKKRIKYLKNVKQRDGYDRICLCRDGKWKRFYVHRLVYESFVGEIPEGMQIDHINTVRDDNRLINLRMVTPMENQNNPVTLERLKESNRKKARNLEWREKMRKSKKRSTPVVQINIENNEVIRIWNTASEACRELGINNGNLSSCCNGKLKSAGGYRWRFA